MEKKPCSNSDEGAKWSDVGRCLLFLGATSERDELYWTAIASADDANGLNCKSLAGPDVEKLRG